MDCISLPDVIHYELLHCATRTHRSVQKSLSMESLSRLCRSLADDIAVGCYRPDTYSRFAITDPKLREIYAPAFRDRLAQSWLVYHLNPYVERQLIDDTYANRKGKGTHAAVMQAQKFMRQPGHRYYLQLDIQNFFNSIHLAQLLAQCQSLVTRHLSGHPLFLSLQSLLEHSILHPVAQYSSRTSGSHALLSSIPPSKTLAGAGSGRGLPLGSAASQMFANLYLSPLDHFIKHTLRVKGYVRYMDDLLLLADSPWQLVQWRQAISTFCLEQLGLRLHPTKQTLQSTTQGADYLGYRIYPHHLHLRQRNINRLMAWLRFFNHHLNGITPCSPPTTTRGYHWGDLSMNASTPPGYPLLQRIQSIINSYLGLMAHARHWRLRRKVIHHHLGKLTAWFIPTNSSYTTVSIKKWVLLTWIEQQKIAQPSHSIAMGGAKNKQRD